MKKKLLALTLVLTFFASCFAGCSFIVKDDERDLQQVVASVQTGDRADEITKRELITYFNSYGYTFMQYYSMTAEETMDYLLNQLVNRKIVLQYAETVLPVKNEGSIVGHHLEKYLTQNQLNVIKKSVNEAVNETVESYLSAASDDDDEDEETEETRTTPTYDEEEQEEIVTEADIPAVDKDSTKAVKNAFSEFEKALKNNYYTYDSYYKMLVVSELEDKVMNLWQESVENGVSVSKIGRAHV